MPRVFTLVSFAVHVVVVAVVLIAQVFDIGPLPTPRLALAYDAGRVVRIADIPLPPAAPRPANSPSPAVVANAAPIAPPSGIAHESAILRPSPPSDAAVVGGIERGGAGLLGPGLIPGAGAPPPPAPSTPTEPTHIHSGIQRPRKIVDVAPEYPALARAARQQGVVILETIIDVRGNVESVRVLRGYPLLDDAAIAAVKQWRFTPALLNGQPVPVVMTVTVNFDLK